MRTGHMHVCLCQANLPSSPTRRSSDLERQDLRPAAQIDTILPDIQIGVVEQVVDLHADLQALRIAHREALREDGVRVPDRKSTRLNSSHLGISYAVFCLKNITPEDTRR